ncbi:formate dehydrogenase accessory protein FdhE [Anaeromyxobacter dehalogenans 2CP-1]|uniref:Formate dehydrogenase accessory protein FdhE n=1 Tax=Anaeromyxobacter dehalogenans (strain ATCC BAA-258 / DSM 21875 / 2CP-1) TaxID=455488 RepID=B8J7P0_ANAD2|nr:formate dehydrogenase accessory protein FdhE [Anaeromyxobacter dehalogenans]ACL67220.1 formate dehydrogenase accessory protein FdhE [Anaeromyxobacter dehalogenans 2CP-1]
MSTLVQLPGVEIPYLRLPEPGLLFTGRAARLEAVAAERGGDPFLGFLGRLAGAQRAATAAVPGFTPPRAPGRPVDRDALAADPALGAVLRALLVALPADGLPDAAAEAVRGLRDAAPDALRRIAGGVLAGASRPEDLAAATFVGAALQVLATVRAARLDPSTVARVEGGCPVCGSPPVAGVVQGDDRLRYLTCSLCAAEWHLPRIRCAGCQATAGLAYHHLENDPGARAETCAACQGYVKLFDLEKRPGSEPFADDAATLALDLLLGEAGHGRVGPNLFLPVAG